MGVIIVAFGVLKWNNAGDSTAMLVVASLVILFGTYVVVASLVPYKNTTETIGDEVLEMVFVEIPIRIGARLLGKLGDLF